MHSLYYKRELIHINTLNKSMTAAIFVFFKWHVFLYRDGHISLIWCLKTLPSIVDTELMLELRRASFSCSLVSGFVCMCELSFNLLWRYIDETVLTVSAWQVYSFVYTFRARFPLSTIYLFPSVPHWVFGCLKGPRCNSLMHTWSFSSAGSCGRGLWIGLCWKHPSDICESAPCCSSDSSRDPHYSSIEKSDKRDLWISPFY